MMAQAQKVVGMNIDKYLEKFGTSHHDYYIVYTRSSGRIVYFGKDEKAAISKLEGKAVRKMICPMRKVSLGKEKNTKLAYPSAW